MGASDWLIWISPSIGSSVGVSVNGQKSELGCGDEETLTVRCVAGKKGRGREGIQIYH